MNQKPSISDRRSSVISCDAERRKYFFLLLLHHLRFPRGFVIVAKKVKHAVGDKEGKFPAEAVAVILCLGLGALIADDDVAKNQGTGFGIEKIGIPGDGEGKIRRSIVTAPGKRENVGGPVDPPELPVVFPDSLVIGDLKRY